MSEDNTMHTIVPVIQLDRDAAADSVFRRIKLQSRFINDDAIVAMVRAYRTGLHDKDEEVQEFARHRLNGDCQTPARGSVSYEGGDLTIANIDFTGVTEDQVMSAFRLIMSRLEYAGATWSMDLGGSSETTLS